MAEVPKRADHQANRLLAALAPGDFARLEPFLEILELPRGKVLYERDETMRYAYFPHDSVVSLVAVMKDGTAVEMAVFGREAVLGFTSALVTRDVEALGRYVVRMSGTASRIAVERLQEAVSASPNVRQLFLRFTEALFAQTLQAVACNAVHGVEARCCRWILSTRDRIDRDALPLTHEFLAEMLGVQRSTVTMVARTLQSAGLITQKRGVITVIDRARLEDAACECYAAIRQRFERLLPGTYALR
jgi:CRP-like cAMP-binding protein